MDGRRRLIFAGVGAGSVIVLVVVALVGFGGGSLPSGSTTAPSAKSSLKAPLASSPKPARKPSLSPSALALKAAERQGAKDLFVPQVSAATGGSSPTPTGVTVHGPAVRAKNFVAKDVFIAQISPPAATPASSTVTSTSGGEGSGASPSKVSGGGGYIVVLATIPGIGPASQKAAARAVVAAKNAGLKEVVANDAIPGTSGSAPHFTVFTGPYQYQSSVQDELIRALRNGYPQARAQELPVSSGKGF